MEDKILESYFLDMKSEFKDMKSEFKIVNNNIKCLNNKINQLDTKIDKLDVDLNNKIDKLDSDLNTKINKLEDNQVNLYQDVVDIKENHLHHLELDIENIKTNNKWIRNGIIAMLVGIFLHFMSTYVFI
ncbi:MAG: hypothetical protein LBM96_11930 [Methanobrevibacter sp.]|jgi:chromosome segregation ATPase|nr:hypothetical protein [Candidatus Methanoflexus mossambicus]